MEEKVSLPDGMIYRRVRRTVNGRIVRSNNRCQEAQNKPTPPIGGTDVYQKERNRTDYWYSRIKGGRDEFMLLDFADITEHDLYYDANGIKRVFSDSRSSARTNEYYFFTDHALTAIQNKPAEGYRWIPVYEPSMGRNEEIQFIPGREVLDELTPREWEKLFEEYSPQNCSQLASTTTYFLILMRWLKDGIVTLPQILFNSGRLGGNFYSGGCVDRTGERQFGGLYGFVGNTSKIVKDPRACNGFTSWGDGCRLDCGDEASLTDRCFGIRPQCAYINCIGLLELTK